MCKKKKIPNLNRKRNRNYIGKVFKLHVNNHILIFKKYFSPSQNLDFELNHRKKKNLIV